jgi:ABC-type sulfate transport system permease component
MPLAIYERFGAGDMPAALMLSAILLGTSLLFLLAIRLIGEPER